MIRAFVTAKVGSSEYLGATKTIKEKIVKIPGVLKLTSSSDATTSSQR